MNSLKEVYFTTENISAVAEEMLQDLAATNKRRRVLSAPEHSALLVLDMQDYFLDPASHAFVPSAPSIIPNIKKLIRCFSSLGKPIIFNQHINTEANAKMMSSWWKDLITEKHPLCRISKELDTSTGRLIQKSQYDAFIGTELEELLVGRGVTQVVISGVMTHLCCESTARSAFMRGFGVLFTVDGTATYNRNFHLASLLNLSHGFAKPILTREILEWMGCGG